MADLFRLLFLGDVIGPAGRAAVRRFVPELRRDLRLDAVIANGENAADNGFGITAEIGRELLASVDFLTLGDHAFDQEGIGPYLDAEPRIIRPANMGDDQPGRGWATFEAAGVRVGVANLMGRVFMKQSPESPFVAAGRAVAALSEAGARVTLVDLQAEATSEKQGMGWYLDGRVTAMVGTHTHTPTADPRILPGGTAFISDVGMTGARDGVIGFGREGFLRLFEGTKPKMPPTPAAGALGLDAVLIEADVATGRAAAVEQVLKREE